MWLHISFNTSIFESRYNIENSFEHPVDGTYFYQNFYKRPWAEILIVLQPPFVKLNGCFQDPFLNVNSEICAQV